MSDKTVKRFIYMTPEADEALLELEKSSPYSRSLICRMFFLHYDEFRERINALCAKHYEERVVEKFKRERNRRKRKGESNEDVRRTVREHETVEQQG